jgi:DNA-binding LacI/PurR family transcriptional regulator
MPKSKITETIAPAGVKKRPQRLQMSDIAKMAGVSTSTVSRALAGSPLVNAETTAKVLALVERESYTVNMGAKLLRTGANRTVAVVVPFDPATRQHVSDPFFLSILGRLADSLTEKGYDMLFTRVDVNRLDRVADVFHTGKASGIIMIGQWTHHEQLNSLVDQGVPLVVWGAKLPSQRYTTVGTDNEWGGYISTRHLLARGRKRVFFLGEASSPESAQRYAGFKRAHAEQKITLTAANLLACNPMAELAEARLHRALDEGIEIDGIVAASDLLAMGAINTLRSRNIAVPGKVAVVGYDDIPVAKFFTPALTTVAQPLEIGADALVDSILAVIRGESVLPKSLTTELRVRDSA